MRYTSVLVIFCLFLLMSCGNDHSSSYRKIAGFTQGTTYHITYQDKANKDITASIDSILKEFDFIFSTYNPNSIVSKINKNDTTIRLNDQFMDVYNKSLEVYHETKGAFDLTVGPLVNAWGFGTGEKVKMDSARVDSLLQYVGMNKIKVEGQKMIKELPGIRIDLNSIAQGYSVDVIYHYIEKSGIENFMVEIGGEVRTKGKNPQGEIWKIGVDKPVEGNNVAGEDLQTIILIDNKAITTSGNYRKYFEEDGVKYTHIIDPKTGYPYKNSLLSVTLIADDALTADGYDTGLMVMGLEGAREFLKRHPEIQAYMIYSDENGKFQVEYTPGIQFEKSEK